MKRWVDGSDLLIGRPKAEQARAALERELRNLAADDAVGLDFRGVKAITVSFTEAFFVPLLGQWATGYHENHPLVVFGANAEVRDTLEAVLRLRHLAVLAVNADDEAALLGGEQGLRETAHVAYALGEFAAADIADRLGLSLQAANNRLKELVQRGALARLPGFAPSGGRQYRYRVPGPSSSGGRNGNAKGRARSDRIRATQVS